MKTKINPRQFLFFVFALVGLAFMASIQMKLNIGVGPWDGMALSLSYVTNLRVGDIATVFSISCVVLTFIILKKDFKLKHILTFFIGILVGQMINFFFYTVLGNLIIESYIIKLILFIVSIYFLAFFVSIIQTIDVISLPLESLCQEIANTTGKTFAQIRQIVDVISVIVIIGTTLIFTVPLTLREGTILSTILFSPATGIMMPFLAKWFSQQKIVPDHTQSHSPAQP